MAANLSSDDEPLFLIAILVAFGYFVLVIANAIQQSIKRQIEKKEEHKGELSQYEFYKRI